MQKIPALQEECGDFLASGPLVCRCSIAEKQRDAPDSGETHQGIDHAADGAAGPAEQEGHDVKAKDADAAPVESADNGPGPGRSYP